MVIDKSTPLWQYLSSGQKDLFNTGEFLLEDIEEHSKVISDYSFVVFPFAKAYEGFLKQFFLDMGFINKFQYESTHFRIGKVLNPNLVHQLGNKSVYTNIVNYCENDKLANTLWIAWKRGRNLLFHYFPHNVRSVSFKEAKEMVILIIEAMNNALATCSITPRVGEKRREGKGQVYEAAY